MTKSNSNSNRTSSKRGPNRGGPTVHKAGFTTARREYGNGGRCK